MFPGKNSLTKRIPADLSSARAQQERVRRSFPIFHPSAKTHFFKGLNVLMVRKNPHRGEGSSTEFPTELIPQSLCLGIYLPAIPALASQITPSPFLSNLFWVYFLTVPLFNFLEGRTSLRSSRIVSLTYLDEDHPRFTDPRMNFSLYNNSTENKEASLVKMSSEMSPWLSVPRVSHRENAAWREALLN